MSASASTHPELAAAEGGLFDGIVAYYALHGQPKALLPSTFVDECQARAACEAEIPVRRVFPAVSRWR